MMAEEMKLQDITVAKEQRDWHPKMAFDMGMYVSERMATIDEAQLATVIKTLISDVVCDHRTLYSLNSRKCLRIDVVACESDLYALAECTDSFCAIVSPTCELRDDTIARFMSAHSQSMSAAARILLPQLDRSLNRCARLCAVLREVQHDQHVRCVQSLQHFLMGTMAAEQSRVEACIRAAFEEVTVIGKGGATCIKIIPGQPIIDQVLRGVRGEPDRSS